MSPKPRIVAALLAATLLQSAAQAQAPAPLAPPTATVGAAGGDSGADPYAWLEDVEGERALAWVRERNAATQQLLQSRTDFGALRSELAEVLNAKDRIPGVTRQGAWLYNFWTDAAHKRGLWRRTSLAEFRKPEPAWETVIDVDALGAQEGHSWVWGGASCLPPQYRRCLVQLSRGGGDAHVVREFDTVDKRFVDGGFTLPEAKTDVVWKDADTLYVGTDFGPGSLTDSGYPRVIKRWRRGTPLASAETVFEGVAKDVAAAVDVDPTPGFERTVFARAVDFFNTQRFLLQPGAGGKQALLPLDVPGDSRIDFWRDKLLIQLKSDWPLPGRTYPSGSLLMADAKAYLKGRRQFQVLFTPTPSRSLQGHAFTRGHLLLNVSEDVSSRLEEWTLGARPTRRVVKAPFPGKLSARSLHDPTLPRDELGDAYFVNYTDFLTPDTLFLAHAGTDQREVVKQRTPMFDSNGMRVEQRFATSKDGTRVPYYMVWPKGATADGKNPTLLYGYGGFEVSLQPFYSPGYGRAWYSRGGVLVVANLRGGGEYGPAWHQAAMKANKQKSYDDFIAVAEDLVRSKVTSPAHLGIMGGSNGGLLVGATFVQRPDLFNAVVCQVPLLDMRKYHTLLAGASWMAEYGNPDDAADWAHLQRISPYHNVRKETHYPKVMFTTSTRDDRVHPAHARKMAARMLEQGHELLYYENIEGGHGGAADNEQRANLQAMEYAYLWMQLAR